MAEKCIKSPFFVSGYLVYSDESYIFFPFYWFRKDSCQFLVKECAQVLVNHLEDYACLVKVWLGKLTMLNMTPSDDWGIKTQHSQIVWYYAFLFYGKKSYLKGLLSTFELHHQKLNHPICAASKDSYQPTHSHSLITIITSWILDNQSLGCKVPSWRQWKLIRLCLHLVHMSDGIATDKAFFSHEKCWYLSYFSTKTCCGTH